MTSHLSSRVLWNWRKRERGKEALPRVHVGRDAQERIPYRRCDRPIVDQINYRVRTENASARRSGGPISASESSCFRRRLFKNLGVIQR
jgi:hypothetical protein